MTEVLAEEVVDKSAFIISKGCRSSGYINFQYIHAPVSSGSNKEKKQSVRFLHGRGVSIHRPTPFQSGGDRPTHLGSLRSDLLEIEIDFKHGRKKKNGLNSTVCMTTRTALPRKKCTMVLGNHKIITSKKDH